MTVLIAGAGPSGLVLALWLAKQKVPVRVIDKAKGPGTESRAIVVQARTLELYQQLGIADAVIAAGLQAKQVLIRSAGKTIAHVDFSSLGEGLSPFPFLLFYPQDEHEKLLIKTLADLGVHVEWESELLEMTEHAQGITATIRDRNLNQTTIEAQYLCGCDGAHSRVRELMQTSFPGGTYDQVFYVADVLATSADSTSKANLELQLCVGEDDFCIVMPVRSQGSVRLIGIVPPDVEKKEKIEFNDVKPAVMRDTELSIQSVNWFSTYHIHHRMAYHFQKGRVFLVGDAAHIHSPAGGQGMNTGIGDAVNLAWKLASVSKNVGSVYLLETYSSERMPFAKVLLKTTDQLFQFMASRSFFGKMWRSYGFPYLLMIITHNRYLSRYLFKAASQIRIAYPNSGLSVGRAGKIKGGDRLPWVKMNGNDNYQSLQGLCWQIHVYGKASEALQEITREKKITLRVFPWHAAMKAANLIENAIYVIRPDGYIGLASQEQNISMLNDYLDRFYI